jgi:ubiquinone/menaquinone biosynthesis C-methylase UbiE
MKTFEEEWKRRFESFAQDYEVDHLISGWSDNGLKQRLALFKQIMRGQKLSVPAQILDIGCGAGNYVRFLASIGHRVTGLDYSFPSLNRALSADPKQDGHYVGGDAYSLPFCNECFDLVISIGVLQALGSPERALDEMVRVLRPEGLLVIEFLNAFEVAALVRSAVEKLSDRLPRIHTYSSFDVQRWLLKRGVRFIQRTGIFLPPRRVPWLGWIFNVKGLVRLLEGIPGVSLVSAHAFLLIGKKEGD